MQRPVFAANWKMNHGPTEARAFIKDFINRYGVRGDRTVIFFPPALTLQTVIEAIGSRRDLNVGVQNIWTEDKGAFTGENSGKIARDAGAAYVLVGHSERRHVFGETNEQAAGKCAAAVRSQLTAILCVGELIEERRSGQAEAVVINQLDVGLRDVSPHAIQQMAIAYEPVWAIGTGHNATPIDASHMHSRIRKALRERTGEAAERIPILYGGSVNTANASALLHAPEVDGLLVGGASLEAASWATICQT